MANIWQDKKLVSVMSTNCQPTGPTTVRRKQKDRQVKSVTCPPNVVAYNKFMGGVDRCDQLRGYYRLRTKSKKCYKYIFWFLFECCIVNAFTLVKHYCPVTISNRQAVIKDFRQQLATPGRGTLYPDPSSKLPARTAYPHQRSAELVLPLRKGRAISQSRVPLLAVTGAGTIGTTDATSHPCIADSAGRCSAWCPRTVPMVPLALRGTTLDSYNIYNPLCSFAAAL